MLGTDTADLLLVLTLGTSIRSTRRAKLDGCLLHSPVAALDGAGL
jgi:hypothetical protein